MDITKALLSFITALEIGTLSSQHTLLLYDFPLKGK